MLLHNFQWLDALPDAQPTVSNLKAMYFHFCVNNGVYSSFLKTVCAY